MALSRLGPLRSLWKEMRSGDTEALTASVRCGVGDARRARAMWHGPVVFRER